MSYIRTTSRLLGVCVYLVITTMHGRNRITIGLPSHPYDAGTEHVGFSPARQTLIANCTKLLRSAVR